MTFYFFSTSFRPPTVTRQLQDSVSANSSLYKNNKQNFIKLKALSYSNLGSLVPKMASNHSLDENKKKMFELNRTKSFFTNKKQHLYNVGTYFIILLALQPVCDHNYV